MAGSRGSSSRVSWRVSWRVSCRVLGVALIAAAPLLALAPSSAAPAGPGGGACRVENAATHARRASGDGSALARALLDAPAPPARTTLLIRGVCTGHFRIDGVRVALVGRPTTAVPVATLRGSADEQGSVLRVSGAAAEVVVEDLRITGGTGTLVPLFDPAPALTAVGGGIYQSGGSLAVRGASSIDGNTALHPQPYPGVDGLTVDYGAGGGLFTSDTVVTLAGHTVVSGNRSVSGQYVQGGGGGLWAQSGVVSVTEQARITGNDSSGAATAAAARLVLTGSARVDGNTGGGDADPVGGGVRNRGTLVVEASASIDHNQAFWGGGVWNEGGTVLMTGAARIADNTGYLGGGGVLNQGTVDLRAPATITGNSTGGATIHGGGVRNWTNRDRVTGYRAGVTGNVPDDIWP